MIMLNSENIGILPFKGLVKVNDLIYFDGPILTHFKDGYGKDILFYWVDADNKFNRWLVFQIAESDLADYLLKRKNLREIFDKPINDVFYTTEIGDNFNYENTNIIYKENLPSEYFPEAQSYFELEIPSSYEKMLNRYRESYGKVVFLDSCLFIKAEPSKAGKNTNLVGVLDGADLLYGIGNSFKGLIEVETNKECIKKGITDIKRIDKITISLVKAMQPNLIEAKAASLAIAISPNTFTDVGEEFLSKEWRDGIFYKFKTDIIEIDKKNAQDIDKIIEVYGEYNSTKIYKPLIELYNNKKLTISITDKNFTSKRTIRPIKKDYADRLISKRLKIQEEQEERLAKVKYNLTTGKISGTTGLTLFDQTIFTSWKTSEIITDRKRYKLKRSLISEYKLEGKLNIIENDDLGIFATGDSKPEAETNFYDRFDELYKELIEEENINLDARQLEVKRFMEFYL